MPRVGYIHKRFLNPSGRVLGILSALSAMFELFGFALSWQLARGHDCTEEADGNGPIQESTRAMLDNR